MSDEGEKSSWLEPLPEEYASDSDMTGRRMLIAALTVVILAIFGGLIWYSYLQGNDNGPVPAVRADKSVVKVKPDNPGGMEVPDQDKRIFDRVTADQAENIESLAPSAELPVERPEEKAVVEQENQDEAQTETKTADAVPPTLPTVSKENTTQKNTESATQKMAAIAPASLGGNGEFLIQLGAFGKKDSAQQLWKKLQQENASILSELKSDIMMVDLGKKGVLYRLRGGLIADRAAADKICSSLKAKKQACIVVKK